MSQRNSGIAVMASLIIGFILGLAAMFYIIRVWVPGDLMYSDSTPFNLAFNGKTGDYRDFFVTTVAREYQRQLNAPGRQSADSQRAALQRARTMLGVTTGDATPVQAADIVSATLAVVKLENDSQGNKDDGWFLISDEAAIAKLSGDLNRVRGDAVPIEKTDARDTSMMGSSTLLGKLLRLLPLALLFVMLGLIAWYLVNAILGRIALPFLNGGIKLPKIGGTRKKNDIIVEEDPPESDPEEGYTEPEPAPPARRESVRPPVSRQPTVHLDPPVNASLQAQTQGRYQPAAYVVPQRASPLEMTATQDEYHVPTALGAAAAVAATSPSALSEARNLGALEYLHGNEIFDEDFDVTNAKGMLIGTCGASIAERIGMTQPSQVNALLISVFDKAAFKTTSKVLVAPGVLHNAMLTRKLREKGELVTAKPGDDIMIDTHTLRVHCKVNTLDVANDGDPGNGYFRKVSLAFGSQQKA